MIKTDGRRPRKLDSDSPIADRNLRCPIGATKAERTGRLFAHIDVDHHLIAGGSRLAFDIGVWKKAQGRESVRPPAHLARIKRIALDGMELAAAPPDPVSWCCLQCRCVRQRPSGRAAARIRYPGSVTLVTGDLRFDPHEIQTPLQRQTFHPLDIVFDDGGRIGDTSAAFAPREVRQRRLRQSRKPWTHCRW